MDNPDLIVGYEVGYSLIDEADVLPKDKMKDVFRQIIARNRKPLPNGDVNSTDMVSTPEGFKFLYDFFRTNNNENKNLIKASTYDNPFLSDDYIAALEDSYDSKQIAAYLNGEFTNLTSGTVYVDYDVDKNSTDREVEAEDSILFVGMDFNVTNMSAVFHVVDKGIPTAVDEITSGYNTEETCKMIKERYPNKKIVVYPDASGASRKTSSSTTDHDIIRQHGFQVYTHKTNPFVKDRINTVNMMLRKGYKVNRHKCPMLAQGLEQQAYDKNGQPDKSSGLDHVTDAAGYYIYTFSKPKNTVYI